jgi:hypothetical protein
MVGVGEILEGIGDGEGITSTVQAVRMMSRRSI